MGGSRRKYKRSRAKVRVDLPKKNPNVFKPAFSLPPKLRSLVNSHWDDKGSVIDNYKSFGVVSNPNLLGVRCRTSHMIETDSLQVPPPQKPPPTSDDDAGAFEDLDDSGSEVEEDVCDGSFFPSLLKEMSEVVGSFNKRAQRLLELHLASGFRKYLILLKERIQGNHIALVQEGKDLVTYAIINAIAVRKILKKYDKIHYSKQGQAFKSQAQSMHIEILQSPWLSELMAFHINLRENKGKNEKALALFDGCFLIFDEGKPSLTCELFDSIKLDIDLTCSICLDTVFDPVALNCGHIFCYICACKGASVTIVDGLHAANPKEKCPLCREEGVYEGAVHLEELNILLSRSCPEYWKERLRTERVERLRLAKEHWESQCRAFIGV